MRDTLPPLASLHALVLLAETGSLTTTAARLNVTQPAISNRIRALEAHLGTGLLHRGANSVRLTEAGKHYAAAFGKAFDAIRGATSAICAGPGGPLRVRAYTTWALRWLIPRLSRFRARYPGQEVEVTTSIAPVDFAREPVDAAIRSADHAPAPGAERLQVVDVAPYAAPALARTARRQGLPGMTLLGSRVRPRDWAIWAAAAGRRPSPRRCCSRVRRWRSRRRWRASAPSHNPFIPLGIAALATERVQLATSVAISFPRSPMIAANMSWELTLHSGGRFVLGLGTQVRAHNERRFSVPWVAPAARMGEYVQALRAIWHCWETGDTLDYDGELYSFSLMNEGFSPGPNHLPMPLVTLAAVGPLMLRTAARLCDGVRLHSFATRAYLEHQVEPTIARHLAEVGMAARAI